MKSHTLIGSDTRRAVFLVDVTMLGCSVGNPTSSGTYLLYLVVFAYLMFKYDRFGAESVFRISISR